MPEFRQKLKGKKLTSTPKKKVVKNVDTVELESDRSSDDFNILDTRKDLVGDRYIAAEFEDGTTRPLFKRKLQKTIVGENSTARLECEVAGIPQPKVLWLKNNRPLFESDHCKVITDGAIHALEFTDTRREDTGLYTARAMNVNGSTISTTEFYVGEVQPSLLNKYKEGLSDAKYQTPAYFFQMNSCQVEEGRLARFDCRVVAYPKPDIVWMKDGKIVEPNDRYKLLNFNNEIYSLLIQNVVKDDMGRYTCWAHNKYGEAMTEAYLNVIAFHDQQDEGDMAPQFLTRFYDQTLTEGVPAELQCLIDGRPMPTIKWLFNDIEIIPNDNIALLQEKNLCSLCIKQVTPKDLGTYTCNLKNPLGEASCSAGLNVLSEKIKNVPVLPKFLKRITDQNMRTGEGVTFEVVVIGEPPPKVSWLFNHKPISESRRRFTISQDGDVYRLSIEDLILDDDGKITCKAVNSEGEVYCSGNLLVRESRKAQEQPDEPKFTQKDFDAKYGYLPTFLKKIDDISVPSGKDGKFECRIMGIPEPTITWLKDSKPLTNDGRHWISQDGGNCYLTVRGVTDKDQGCYTCTIANAAGESSCTGYMRLSEAKKPGEYFERESSLTPGRRGSQGRGEVPTMPYEKPTISDVRPESMRLTWQPVLTSALSSDSKNVKYIIEGRELPDAEWRKLASGIHGNTYLLRNLRPQRDYDFRVRAENQFGLSDATQPATLERPRPEIEELSESMKSKVPSFRRPPELPRSKPHIADMGTESLKLAWQPAVLPPIIKKPPPVTYRLEAQELPATDWLPLTSRLTDTSHYLTDLLPDRDYNIRVRAENQYGLSEPTESIWIPRAKAYLGVPIARPEIIEMEPNMVKLRWERVDVPSFSADDENLRYMIEMQAPPARDWSTVGRDIAGTVYVVSDLEPGQDYRFRVRARTPLGVVSEPSPVTSVYRTFATTRAPIDSLELEDEDVDFDGIRLRWNRVQIPPYSAGEEPLLYMIEVNEPPLDEWRPVVSGLPTTRYRVTDLVPDRDYNFRVRALSSYGISPPSYTLPVSYRRPLPGPSRILPEYPQIVYDDSDALQLSWQPPKVSTPLREPIRYRVELQAPPSLTWKPLATGIPETRYPIRGLGPSRDYMFRVVPETTAGLLEPLPPVSLTSLPAPRTFLPSRPEILDYEPDSFMLSWRRPYLDTHLPMMYRIDVQEPPSLDWRPLVSDITDTRYRVTGLLPSRDYSFRIVPYAGSDYWESLPPVTITSLPVKPRFRPHEPTITPLGSDSVKLSWKPADIPMYPRTPVPIRYIIDMRTLPSYDWIPMARNIADTSYIVKGLIPDKEYQFRVRPQTDYGIGEPTMPATYYRRPVPYVSREPVVSNIYADSVLLSWQPAEFKGDFKFPPNVTYTIEVQDRPGAGPWTPFVSGIQGTNYHVTGLHPDREYFFRVRSHVGDVFGEPSAPVYLTHRAGPPRMPHEQPYISELSPNSVHLQWRAVQLPSRITDYAPVSYRLEIQELPRSDWVILADGIPHTDFHVTNLHPDKEYNFRVRAINKYGCSEPTPLVQIRRRAVPPHMPKDEPLIYDIGHGSLMLSWRPAEVPFYLGDSSVTYTIYVQEPPSMTWRPLYRRIPYTSYHVTNLHPDRDYCFRIQAENMYGLSQPTNTVRLTRLSDFRSPIDIPEITEFDETRSSLQLRWKPRYVAPFDKGPLRYHIESWEPVKRTWRRLAADIPDTSYRLTGLSPENNYILRIRAQAETALSEPSYPISTSKYRGRVPITRPQLYDVDQDSVRLSWQPYPGVTAPRRYHLELRESSSRDWRPVTTDIYGTTHKVTGLKPKQDYQFRLRGITEQGPTDYIYSVPLHRRSVIPRLPLAGVDVVGVEDDYVDLRWRLVDIPAFDYDEKPLAFLIEAQQLPRYDWVPVASGISDTGYRVKGLQRNQDYVFRIRGEYPSGLSQPSQHVSVYRRPSESHILTSYIPNYRTSSTTKCAPNVASPSKNVAPLSTNNPSLRSKQQKFLDQIQKLDRKKNALFAQVQKFEDGLKNFGKDDRPPMSPRSRRDKFMAEQKKPKTSVKEKKPDFMSALEKFRKFETKPSATMTSQNVSSSMVDLTSINRRYSVDFKSFERTPSKEMYKPKDDTTQNASSTKRVSAFELYSYKPRASSYGYDDIILRSRINDVQFRRKESPSPMPLRTQSSSISSRFGERRLFSKRETALPVEKKPLPKVSLPKKPEIKPRSSSWHGESIDTKTTPKQPVDKDFLERSRSESRHRSLSQIGQSVYHGMASRSSSVSHSLSRRSVSRAPSLPPIGVSAQISNTMSKFMQSVNRRSSYDRRSSLTDYSSTPHRSYSVSTDLKFHKPGVDTRSTLSSRSRSRSVTGSAGRSASYKYQRSSSPVLMEISPDTSKQYMAKVRSHSAVSGGSIPTPSPSARSSVADSGRLGRPRKSSVLSSESLPMPKQKNVSYTSYVPKTKCFRDMPLKRDATPARSLPKTPPLARKSSPSRSKASTPARFTTPPRSKASSPAPSETVLIVRDRASSVSSAGSGRNVPSRIRTSSISSSGSGKVSGFRNRTSSMSSTGSARDIIRKPSDVLEKDKPAWIKAVVSRFQKHLA